MNELLDKLLIRLTFAFILLSVIYCYKWLHLFFYKGAKNFLRHKLELEKNPAESLYFLARILAIGLALSTIQINLLYGPLTSIIEVFIQGMAITFLLLSSWTMMESIDLYAFEYQDEIIQRKNICYALLASTHTLNLSIILRTLFPLANGSLITLLFIYSLALIMYGSFARAYRIFYKKLDRQIHDKCFPALLMHLGYLIAATLLVINSLHFIPNNIENYLIQVVLQLFLAFLIFPFFNFFLRQIFHIEKAPPSQILENSKIHLNEPILSEGIFMAVFYITCALLTTVITNNLNFVFLYSIS